MKLTSDKVLNKLLVAILGGGLVVGAFYLGLIVGQAQTKGVAAVMREQGLNVFFGVVGGVITSALIWYWDVWTEKLVAKIKADQTKPVTGLWEEIYDPAVYQEAFQEQQLIFELEQHGPKISGKLSADDTPECPVGKRHGLRVFEVSGFVEGSFVSLDAILESKEEYGHIVYLLKRSDDGAELDGWTVYFDQNHKILTAAKAQILRRTRKQILDRIRSGKPIAKLQ